MLRQPIVAGNWKMNGSLTENQRLIEAINAKLMDVKNTQVLIFPPFVYLTQAAQLLNDSNSVMKFGSQNISDQDEGAYTGEISSAMLRDVGCDYVLVGHSERRSLYNESSQLIARKFVKALDAGLTPILCVGESLTEREAGQTLDIVFRQLDAVIDIAGIEGLGKGIIAYEPIWAIGTGVTATPEQAQDVHHEIRSHIEQLDETVAAGIQILYGGSVNATNAAELFTNQDIDGGLIGGASLKADDFINICVAAG